MRPQILPKSDRFCAESAVNWLANNPIRFELIRLVSIFVDSAHCETALPATYSSAARRDFLSCSNLVGDDVLDKRSQRRRRVARLAHAEGEQPTALTISCTCYPRRCRGLICRCALRRVERGDERAGARSFSAKWRWLSSWHRNLWGVEANPFRSTSGRMDLALRPRDGAKRFGTDSKTDLGMDADAFRTNAQRRRRVARLAHAEGEQREAGSVGKVAS
jgi:hypothetical protein